MNIVKDVNLSVFKFFNINFGQPQFKKFLTLINAIGDPNIVYYHLLAIFAIACFLIFQTRNDKNALKRLLILGFSATVTFVISFCFSLAIIVELIKTYAAVARPFCSLNDIHALQHVIEANDCFMSFPSGHTSFTIILITSFWPLLNRFFKTLAITFLFMLMISRMASGAHYPMDLLGATVICLPMTICIREKVTKLVIKYESRCNLFKKFSQGA
jgi:membrane-associated phospholipid phosphatase